VPEIRTTPSGMPVMRLEVDCGDGREGLRLRVVMAGEGARELGGHLRAGSTVNVIGALRAVRAPVGPHAVARGVEVVASKISEVAAGAAR
jgi:primosomal replication protein N